MLLAVTDRPEKPVAGLRGVRIWLICVAALIVCTLLVGGATRLTESGLSIVEWKPVTGMIPPLTDAQWSQQFEAYKTIPQYREMNAGMSLSEFKTIFFWEWGPPAAGTLDRWCIPVSVSLVSLEGRLQQLRGIEAQAVDHLRHGRASRRGRMVDGQIGPH